MELLIIEMLLWIGFAFLLWAMRESLMRIEQEVESRGIRAANRRASVAEIPPADQPQRLIGPIGRYDGHTIHEYAVINGRGYRFDHVCPSGSSLPASGDRRWVAPGLVYVECTLPFTAPSTA